MDINVQLWFYIGRHQCTIIYFIWQIIRIEGHNLQNATHENKYEFEDKVSENTIES
jgi:hypothetical protein